MKKVVCFVLAFALFTVPIIVQAEEIVMSDVVGDDIPAQGEAVNNEVVENETVADGEVVEDGNTANDDEASNEKESTEKNPESVTINANEVTIVDNSEPEIEPYVVPSTPIAGGWYIEANTSQLGDVKIYVPVNYKEGSFAYTNDNVISLQSSTITGVMYASSGVYTIRFTAFASPQYRTYDSGYTYADLNIGEVYSSNVEILDSDPPKSIPSYVYWGVLILIVGVICICKFMML